MALRAIPARTSDLLVYTDMVVPVGMTVLLDITADDVVHSWWMPKLGGKFDAVPGYTNKTWFQIRPSAIKDGQKQVVFTGSAPSCAVATTRTCTDASSACG